MVDITMKHPLFLLFSLILLASCNVVVTSPNRPELNVNVDGVTGRWHAVEVGGVESEDDYLQVSQAAAGLRYRADIYENGLKDDSPLFSLCPGRRPGEYWGFAVRNESHGGDLIFHLILSGDRAEFRWLDRDAAAGLFDDAGLTYEKRTAEGVFKWGMLRIRASRAELLAVLNQGGTGVLSSDPSVFKRLTP